MRFASPLLLVAALSKSVDAFSSGAGACGPGNTSVQGPHLMDATTGSLSDGGFTISLDGTALSESKTSTFAVGEDVKVTVAGKSFKGFLVRLGQTDVDTKGAFTPGGDDVQVASACFDAGGITHKSGSVKTTVSATLNLAEAATDMPVDVTVVVVNSGGKSEYYYSQFMVTAGAAAATEAPVAAPTEAPVEPTAPDTDSPVAAPTPSAPVPLLTSAGGGDKECEDDRDYTFSVDEIGTRGCFWLSKRPAQQSSLCTGDVKAKCAETCGACSDDCEDDPDAMIEFEVVGGKTNTNTCEWLKDHIVVWPLNCMAGSEAYEKCKDTCNNCAGTSSTFV
jgi:hypothetical protein